MAQDRNWLDDPELDPLQNPYGAAQTPAPAADTWATPTQPSPAAPPPLTAQADAGSWMPPQQDAAPAATGAPGDYTQDTPFASVDPAQIQAGAAQGGITAGTQAADQARYQSYLDAVRNAADPQSKAVAQDALARQVQKDLEADGHKVSWKGNILMVDGREYELGGEHVQSTGGYAGAKDVDSLIQHYQSHNPVGSGIDGLVQFLQQNGVNAKRATHAGGVASNDAIDVDGQIYDEIFNVGGADQHWQHNRAGGGGDPMSALSGGHGGSWLDGAGGSDGFLGGFSDAYQLASAASPIDQQMDAYVMNLLQNPESVSEHDVQTLQAKSAEEAAAAAQLQDEELQHFGYGAGLDSSPWLAGQRTQNQWNRRSATIESNRNIDIAAADRRGRDRQAAAGIGQAWASLKSSQKHAALSFAVSYLSTELGYDISLKRLSEQSEEFKANLIQRINEMQQADAQFRANYGLQAQLTDHNIDQDMWSRGRDAYDAWRNGG